MTHPLLSIIIANYNTANITVNCLKSIYQDKGLKEILFEIIVIDNHSTDNSVLKIKKFIHSLKIVNCKLKINSENVGFGQANNQGFQLARGNYILMLNSDTLILHSSVSQCLNWLSSHPEAGMCTARLLNPDGSIQGTGGFFPNLLNLTTWCLGLDDLPFVNKIIPPIHPHTPAFYTRDNFYLNNHPQDWLTGAFILARRELIEKCRGFDENYFMYGEELEMQYRIKKLFPHLQNWYLVGPEVTHIGRASTNNNHYAYQKEHEGMLAFFKKHHPSQVPVVRFLISLNQFLRQTIYQLFKKDV